MGRDDRRTKVRGRVPVARWAVLAAVPTVAAVVLSGCGAGSGEQVLTSDERPERDATIPEGHGAGADPAAVLTAAASGLETSGRFHGEVEVGGLATMTQDGEFSGADVAVRTTMSAGSGFGEMFGESGGSEPDRDLSIEMRSVGGRAYVSADLSTDGGWIAADTSGSGLGASVASPTQLAQAIRSLQGVEAAGSDTIDGESVEVYRGTTTLSELGGAFGGAGSLGSAAGSMPEGVELPAMLQRIERVNQLIQETLEVEVSVAVDGQGRLRRLSMATGGELPADLADCALLAGPLSTAYDLSATFTFSDLDADITIEAPDPSTVTDPSEVTGLDTGLDDLDPADVEGAFDEAFGGEGLGEAFGEGFDELAGGMVDKLLEGCPS